MDDTNDRAELERALDEIRREKLKHSVISPIYFELVKRCDELKRRLNPQGDSK